MNISSKHLTRSAAALLAASKHLQRKDAGDDPFELLTKRFGEHAAATLRRLEETDGKMAGLQGHLMELEQSAARGGGGGGSLPETWGQQFTSNGGLKSFADEHTRPGRFRLQMKDVVTSAAASGGGLGVSQRDDLVLMPQRRLAVRDLLPTIRISSNSVEYPRQVSRATAANAVAEGALKPESSMTFELLTTNTTVIAHWVPASRQILDDVPQLRGIIDSDLRYGLALKEERQLLLGDGTGANLLGLVPRATAFAAPFSVTGQTMIDTLGLAILQSALADFPADGIVLHPSDWMRMRMLKDADGHYLLGDPQKVVQPTLFGLPVVGTQEMSIDKFLVGNFQAAATLYDRWEARVEVSTEHSDFFVRNLVALLAEERVGLAVKQPLALTYGDFGNVV